MQLDIFQPNIESLLNVGPIREQTKFATCMDALVNARVTQT